MLAQKNVTVVYNTTTGQPVMVVVDANNLTDPSWNPQGHAQISVDIKTYNAATPLTWQAHLASIVNTAMASIQNAQVSAEATFPSPSPSPPLGG